MKPPEEVQIMTEIVKVARIREGSDSIKMTIPPSVKGFMDLEPGDEVVLDFQIENGKKIVKMSKK